MDYNTLWRAFARVMVAAKIAPRRRLGWYGMRRGSVDAADSLTVSAGALQQLGGRASAETPLTIYKGHANCAGSAGDRARVHPENPARKHPVCVRESAP